jgi:hypothetical protein
LPSLVVSPRSSCREAADKFIPSSDYNEQTSTESQPKE